MLRGAIRADPVNKHREMTFCGEVVFGEEEGLPPTLPKSQPQSCTEDAYQNIKSQVVSDLS